jgi:imidazolonepropionase-like amidohydrolase
MNLGERIAAWVRRRGGSKEDRPAHADDARADAGPWPTPGRLPASASPRSRSGGVVAGWLIDGSGGPIRASARLEFVDGVFHRIADAPPPGAPADPQGGVGDFSACTVLPGLVDSHVHLAMTGSMDEALRARLRQSPAEVVFETIQENLREHLRCGVVAVRDGGGARGNAVRFSKGIQRRTGPAVRVFAAGRAWHRYGRYGRFIGRPPGEGLSLAQSILRDEGPSDLVKIVHSGVNSLTEFGRRTAPQFNLDEMTAAVRAAGQRGRPVMVHANGEEPVRIAVAAGCGSVEHGFFMGPENLERLAESGTVWVPTVVPLQAYAERLGPSDRRSQVAQRTVEHQLEQLQRARRLNVAVALGTDAGSAGVDHGLALIAEMKLLMSAGFSLAETVRCASFNGAALTGGGFGLLAAGRPATFAVVPGDPSGLPDSLNRVCAVYVDGERVVAAG